MSFNKIIFQLSFLFFLFGCVPNKKINKEEVHAQKNTYQQIAEKKFGEKAEYALNSDKSYVLCENIIEEPLLNPNQLTEFFVYDIQKGEIIYTDKLANAKISWHNNTQLLITNQKGYIANPTDTGKWTYIFDLKSKRKITQKKPQ